jgi:hypothetical protein
MTAGFSYRCFSVVFSTLGGTMCRPIRPGEERGGKHHCALRAEIGSSLCKGIAVAQTYGSSSIQLWADLTGI